MHVKESQDFLVFLQSVFSYVRSLFKGWFCSRKNHADCFFELVDLGGVRSDWGSIGLNWWSKRGEMIWAN